MIDTRRHLPLRRVAIDAHRSQSSQYAGLPDDLAEAFLTNDRLRRVIPPWRGGEVESDIIGMPTG